MGVYFCRELGYEDLNVSCWNVDITGGYFSSGMENSEAV